MMIIKSSDSDGGVGVELLKIHKAAALTLSLFSLLHLVADSDSET